MPAATANSTATGNGHALAAARRYFETSLFLLISTSALTVVATGKLDPISTFVPVGALLVKGVRFFRGHGPELSHRAATALTVLYFCFFPFDLIFISRALAAGAPNPILYGALLSAIHLMLFAMVVRLFSASTTRDHMFLALLAFAMMLMAAILTVDTMFLVFFLVFLVLAVATFVGLEMRRSSEGAVAPALAEGTPAARRLQRALTLTSIVVALGALVLGTVVFYILPRVTGGFLSGYNLGSSMLSGFSENDELGQIGEIKKNPAVVMRIRVAGGPASMRGVKWRGLARTTFDGHAWATAAGDRQAIPPGLGADRKEWFNIWYDDSAAPRLSRDEWYRREQHGRDLRYTVLLEPLDSGSLFVAAEPRGLSGRFSPEVRTVGSRSRDSYLVVDRTLSVFNPFHNLMRTLYEGESRVYDFPADLLRTASTDYPDSVRELYLQLPEKLDSRIRPFAERIAASAANPYDKAAAIERYLNTRFGYTLELPPPTPDPLAHFLFWRQSGHCEYFATAMTVMLRTVGIPARYVKGFQPGEFNDVASSYIVRGSDAHTWVEAYFPGYGWVAFDPTPPSGTEVRSWLGRFAYYYDWFELAWSEWVINYNSGRQETLAANVVRASAEWTASFRKYWQAKQRTAMRQMRVWHLAARGFVERSPGTAAWLAALAVLAAGIALRGRQVREFIATRWGVRLASDTGLNPRRATLLYQQMLRLLARRGVHKQPGQTALEFAAGVPSPELAAPVAEFTEMYQSARFGAASTEAQRMASLLESIKMIARRS